MYTVVVAVGSLVPKDMDGVVFMDMGGFKAQIIVGTRRREGAEKFCLFTSRRAPGRRKSSIVGDHFDALPNSVSMHCTSLAWPDPILHRGKKVWD